MRVPVNASRSGLQKISAATAGGTGWEVQGKAVHSTQVVLDHEISRGCLRRGGEQSIRAMGRAKSTVPMSRVRACAALRDGERLRIDVRRARLVGMEGVAAG